jgi:hypothetical protein
MFKPTDLTCFSHPAPPARCLPGNLQLVLRVAAGCGARAGGLPRRSQGLGGGQLVRSRLQCLGSGPMDIETHGDIMGRFLRGWGWWKNHTWMCIPLSG